MTFTLTSPDFADGEAIPKACTCDGADAPPALRWSGTPDGTRSFALVVDDPDAPGGTFTHWLLYDLAADLTALPAGQGGRSLPNDFGRPGYGGPCPPRGHGRHRYVFTLFAVDVPALSLGGTGRAALTTALETHTLGTARLTGHYERARR